jgi:hypothetical protein
VQTGHDERAYPAARWSLCWLIDNEALVRRFGHRNYASHQTVLLDDKVRNLHIGADYRAFEIGQAGEA